MKFSSYDRQESYHHLENQHWDLLVIGGGITGAGIALDATARGLKTAVIEMQDFAAGTSSRSTKLVHGGLRYLKQFEVKMVAEVGKEREIVYENGPHVTTPEWMLLPFYKGGTFGPLSTNLGLRVYDFLAGVKKGERRKMLSREETLRREPLLKKEGLKGGGYYVEYKTDDARLTIEVMKKAVEKGALALNYAKVTEFIYENQKVLGVKVEDQITRNVHHVYAKKIINAAGPWVDTLREKDQSKEGKTLQLTKGIHLVFDGKRFPLKQAIYFDMPDGRMAFAIPREGKVYVGTTDTVYKADIAHPTMTRADRDYVLRAIEFMFPEVGIGVRDIESSWAGLRPLIREEGKDPSEISRKDEIFISESGLISIAGGKLTGYRKMGENVVDQVAAQLQKEQGIRLTKVSTKQLPISGGEVGGSKQFEKFRVDREQQAMQLGLNGRTAQMLTHRYGANVDQVLAIFSTGREHAEQAALDPLVYAMLRYAMEYEAAYKPVDFFVRRTGALYFNIEWVHVYKEAVISYMAKEFAWSDEQAAAYTEELNTALYEAVNPVEDH
ncbi:MULTISPECIES: glycerol-3-phosphate dehydrogenase/oxidase [unclassified Planococcus (in: firmicutes)]|uniref:glycerol-3-phosphate dehydrogenase/oxidase n=1 Tax=unclassified Planococcus (in: firmicutes) TaxID=2662419 RepID=UPI000C32C73B|nr:MULTISPECIES: FAD-dependent oxidoreductase [unclassified Planococcus (in: firmicutes)]AUD13133.1 glycerol-3-phosphate dehydrogenase [Planococcus sp. MB-3u-03]PKG45385.1 glycerol-3-phosphate dehydrogenase [Planococcus sp. Urea-trap-24]PKG89019.1 glycerol-3-phosphate dehydrogenase [Planococcus sp. Urea-3u-39]PKH36387.1 glycerol-3-phosphate dehydrogenase [Planococcus sp. MB-3u-09]